MVSTGCSRNSSDVTTPKLPPPPRSAQNRSGCSFSLAMTTLPSAVTTSADTRLSQDNPQPRHAGQVDHQAAVVDREPVDVVRPTAYGHLEALVAGQPYRGDDIGGVRAAHDQRRPTVDHAVVDGTGLVVRRVGRPDERPPELRAQLVDVRGIHDVPPC